MAVVSKVTFTVQTQVTLDIETLADAFAEMTDDDQAQFFVAVAARFAKFQNGATQGWFIGGHLRNCECSTEEARELIRDIADGLRNSTHGKAA